jgi:hypothetical protein
MKYIILTIALTLFIGCGSNGSKSSEDTGGGKKDVEVTSPPKSPQVKDVKNIPPSVPKI